MERIQLPEHIVIAIAALQEKQNEWELAKARLVQDFIRLNGTEGQWTIDPSGTAIVRSKATESASGS